MKRSLIRLSVRAIALVLGLVVYSNAWASFTMTNPVTGEDETYDNKFTGGSDGTGTEWNNSSNWDPSVTPFVSGDYNASLVSNKTALTSTEIDGWRLRVGAYNGAAVTWSGGITKIQAGEAGCWLTADATSSITLAFNGNNKQLEGSSTYPLKLSSAKAGGITWTSGLANAGNTTLPFWYYLKGEGTVVYGGDITVANAQVIKMADVTLSGTSQVVPKPLVSFTSSSTTFTADAAIKVYDTDGTTLKKTVKLVTVRQAGVAIENATSTLTTGDSVGSCEIVQCTDGIVLYYVDGDPDTIAAYKPSININFTNGAANGLTTTSDVGLDGYAVPGTSWNNFEVANNTTYSTVNAVDSTGVASVASGVSVTVSDTRGHWNCSGLTPASNPLHGYIDESSYYPTPTVTITGIPYEHYRVIVYHSTDQDGAQFGYDTINGFNFTYVDGVQQTGTTSWGSAGASNSAEAIAEGVNTLVSAVLTGDTVTMVAHRIGGGTPTARGCFAAIQVVEYVPEVSENDLEIAVDGATEYEVNEAKELSGTVYLTGSGTLTLTGSDKITAATIDVAKDVVLNINADRLDATTFTGSGTVVYDNTAPVTGKGWAAIGWSGTVWVKNQAVSNFNGNNFGNGASTIRFTGVTGYLSRKTTDGVTQSVPIELVDDGSTVAFSYNDGWGGSVVVVSTLKGTGTFKTSTAGNGEIIYFANADGFTGSFDLANKKVQIGGSEPSGDNQNWNGRLYIPSGATATVASGATWSANNSIDVQGTLNVNGTVASSHASQAVIGSGTVVFTGRAPTPTGDTWWKNANWTGTVEIKDVADMIGASSGFTGTYLDFASYGNAESKIKISNISGWLPDQTFDGELVLAGTLTINNAISGYVFKVKKLSGNGGITSNTSNNSATTTFQAEDPSAFAGFLGIRYKRVVFGSSLPEGDFVHGQIYVGEGVVVTNQYNANNAWWATGGIKVDGELCSPNLTRFGGTTTITTTDTGVFTLVSNSDTDDMNVDYTRIQGTGTLKYEGTNYRTISTNNFPTALVVENNLGAGLIHRNNGQTVSIGSLSGSGQMRSDWGGSGSTGDRDLRILQAKDTTYSGLFASERDRIDEVYVAPGASTAGTLTLSGTQTASNGLIVETGASVNLTGTWVGATTVAGTFGGTGTLTGNLTFSDGATFKAGASALTVSGTVTLPTGEGETLTIDATDLSAAEVTVLSSSSITAETDVSKVTVNGPYIVTPVAGAIKLVHAVAQISGSSTVYISLQAAVDALAQNNKDIVLLANANGATVSRELTFNVVTGEYTSGDIVAGENYILTTTALEGKTRYSLAPAVIAVTINDVRTLYSMINANSGIEAANAGPIGTTIEILSGDPAGYAEYLPMFDLNTDTGVFTKVTNPVAAVYEGVIQQQVYRTLADAVSAAAAEQTVKLLADVTLDATIAIDKTLTLDLNGYTITASGINAITTSGALTVEGSSGSVSVTSGNSVVLTSSAATLTVSGGATLSPTPTTNVSRSRVVPSTSAGTTTYSVEVIPGTIFSVY